MSVRSNQDRLGGNQPLIDHQDAPPAEMVGGADEPESYSSLNYVIPTTFVPLPSKGRFYSPQHPLHSQDVVEIRHMTAKEEDILTSKTLITKGLALDRMLQNLIVDKRVKVKELLIGDKNALLVAARQHDYGSDYITRITCPRCATPQDYSFDLDTLEPHDHESEWSNWNVELSPTNTLLLPLPKTQFTVELKLLTSADERRMSEQTKNRRKHKLLETNATDQLKSIVLSVNHVTDRNEINNFINSIPAIDSKYIRRIYPNGTPALNLEHEFVCIECGHEDQLEVPFTADFFWSNR